MEDEDYWFVRRRSAFSYGFTPISWQGWVITALYAGALFAVMRFAATKRWLEWAALFGLATFVFIVIALRASAPERK